MKQLNTFQLGDKYYKIAIYAIFALAVGMSLAQYLYNRSLNMDEAALALNIINKNFIELLSPMEMGQVAPILFLWIEKLFSLLIPNSEFGLRLFPLISFFFALFFFYKILKQELKSPVAIIVAFAGFAFLPTCYQYSSEVKQYMTDVMVLTAIYWFTIKSYQNERQKWLTLGIAGVVAIFLSNVAPIILASVGLYVIYELVREEKRREEKRRWNRYLPVLIVFATWLAFFSVYYYIFAYNHPAAEYMNDFWTGKRGFLPLHFSTEAAKFFYGHFISEIFGINTKTIHSAIGVFNMLFAIFSLIGLIKLITNKQWLLLILIVSPVIIHVTLSAFKLYPFAPRLFLYIRPLFPLLLGYGILSLLKNVKLKYPFLFLALVPLVSLLMDYPYKVSEIKDSIRYVERNIKSDDFVYIPFRSRAFLYYYQTGKVRFDNNWKIEQGEKDEGSNMIEYQDFTGKVWIIFSGYNFRWEDGYETNVINNLESIGCQRLDEFHTFGSSAYLYDFGE